MDRKCVCGNYRWRTVNSKYVKCRKCGALQMKDFIIERQVKRFNSEHEIETEKNERLAALVS